MGSAEGGFSPGMLCIRESGPMAAGGTPSNPDFLDPAGRVQVLARDGNILVPAPLSLLGATRAFVALPQLEDQIVAGIPDHC